MAGGPHGEEGYSSRSPPRLEQVGLMSPIWMFLVDAVIVRALEWQASAVICVHFSQCPVIYHLHQYFFVL